MDRNGMVQMKATTFFTRNSPNNGGILHGDDRDAADPKARFPYVSPEDAEYLEAEGLAEPYDGKVPLDDGDVDVGDRAAAQVEENIDAENSVEATTGLSTRDTTAHSKSPVAMAGEANVRTLVADDSRTAPGSDDAPAGGGKRARSRSGRSRSRGGSKTKAAAPAPTPTPTPTPAATATVAEPTVTE